MSSPAATPALVRIVGVAQSYEWGKLGSRSAVGQLMRDAGAQQSSSSSDTSAPAFDLKEDKPYAELWMGTHPSGPSSVRLPGGKSSSLQEFLDGQSLPFLFKVLSVGKALSIQAHPDQALAKALHASRPEVYKDPQHKPELACALTAFEALCAFRPLPQIAQHAREYPELRALLGDALAQKLEQFAGQMDAENTSSAAGEESDKRRSLLREVFASLMTPAPDVFAQQLAALLARLEKEGLKASIPSGEPGAAPLSPDVASTPLPVGPLILRLAQQYPGDVGIFAPLLLNAFALQPGQSIFLGPSEPHAYLAGDCVECMACSDNVVRAGLTPKLRDTDVLLNMLTYREHTAASALMKAKELEPKGALREFAPPREFGEFRLLAAEVSGENGLSLPAQKGASILLVWSGEGQATLGGSSSSEPQALRRGDVFLVPAGAATTLKRTGAGEEKLLAFLCTANDGGDAAASSS